MDILTLNNISSNLLSSLREFSMPQLTLQQKKIGLIALIAMSSIAAVYAFYYAAQRFFPLHLAQGFEYLGFDKHAATLYKQDVEVAQPLETKEEISPQTPSVDKEPLPLTPIDSQKLFHTLAAQSPRELESFYHPSCSRFFDIICPKESHVAIEGESDSYYLHANHIRLEGRHFIAAQYPLLQKSFWEVCKSSSLIVDLTNDADLKRGLVSYAPSEGEERSFNDLHVHCAKREPIDGIHASFYTYQVNDGKEEVEVKRLHFEGWPDHHGISHADLDRLTSLIDEAQVDPEKPVVIHCRAGVGRTGTIIAASVLKRLIEQKVVHASNLEEKISEIILSGRKQRGPYFVQTAGQLEALCTWCQELLKKNK